MFKKPGTCSRAFLLRGVIVTGFCESGGDGRGVSQVGKSRSNGFSATGFQVGAERQRTRVRSVFRPSGESQRRHPVGPSSVAPAHSVVAGGCAGSSERSVGRRRSDNAGRETSCRSATHTLPNPEDRSCEAGRVPEPARVARQEPRSLGVNAAESTQELPFRAVSFFGTGSSGGGRACGRLRSCCRRRV